MLAKIHLKTACGCTKEFFESASRFYRQCEVPIHATYIPYRAPGNTPTEVWGKRVFDLVKFHKRSARRIELWYEEVVNG